MRLIAVLLVAVCLAGCGGGGTGTEPNQIGVLVGSYDGSWSSTRTPSYGPCTLEISGRGVVKGTIADSYYKVGGGVVSGTVDINGVAGGTFKYPGQPSSNWDGKFSVYQNKFTGTITWHVPTTDLPVIIKAVRVSVP